MRVGAPRRDAPWLGLAILVLVDFFSLAEGLIVAVALPTIQAELGFSGPDVQWVINAYILGYGGFLLIGGRTADRYGRRRVFVIGLGGIIAGSVLAATAPHPVVLVVARFATGMATALSIAAALALLTSMFPPGRSRNLALGVYSLVGSAGFAGGALLGGIVTTLASWRFLLVLSVPFVAIGALVSSRAISESWDRDSPRHLDVAGALLVTAALTAVIFGIIQVDPPTVVSVTGALAVLLGVSLFVAFVINERRSPAPLIPPSLLRSRSLLAANVAAAPLPVGLGALVFVGTLYMQQVLGYTPLQAGLAYLPTAVLLMLVSVVAPPLVSRLGARWIAVSGLWLQAAGLLWLARTPTEASFFIDMLPGFALVGIGAPAAYLALIVPAVAEAGGQSGLASGLFNTAQRVGDALGIALYAAAAAYVSRTLEAEGTSGVAAMAGGFSAAFLIGVLLLGSGGLVALAFVDSDV